MEQRLSFGETAKDAYRQFLALQKYLAGSSIDPELHELIKIRASMINGCAYCIDRHSADASARGETLRRIASLAAWEEAACYTETERAALALTDAMTLINKEGVPDDVWEGMNKYFSDVEICDIMSAIITINCFNRLAITTHMIPQDLRQAPLSSSSALNK